MCGVEVEQLSVKLSERDDAISRLRQQSTDAVSQLEKTHMTELLAVKDLRDELQQQINESRSAVNAVNEGFTSHSTQNTSLRRRSSQPVCWRLLLEKLNLTQQKQTTQEQNSLS